MFQIDLYDSRLEFSDFKTECAEKVKFSKIFNYKETKEFQEFQDFQEIQDFQEFQEIQYF